MITLPDRQKQQQSVRKYVVCIGILLLSLQKVLQVMRTSFSLQQFLNNIKMIVSKDASYSPQEISFEQEVRSRQEKAQEKIEIGPNFLKKTMWTDREHVLYILFLEKNREKAKSKLIRRSNSFFDDMAAFVGTKTGTQCRGHHKKYEAKYKFPHRIIKEEKKIVSLQLYNSLCQDDVAIVFSEHKEERLKKEEHAAPSSSVSTNEVECQTDLQGVSNSLTMESIRIPEYILSQPYFHYSPQIPYLNYYNMWEPPKGFHRFI